MQQRFAVRFTVASERVKMHRMKSERAQPMSLEYLDSEFLSLLWNFKETLYVYFNEFYVVNMP